MIPMHLHISGFLSYRDPAELDFQSFDLACISGRNGAGKSALLDAMTWSLFGQARKRDESVVNLQSKAAEVALTFQYEGNVYRVQRTIPRGKSALLEFQIRNGEGWRPLTERTLRETQARIEGVLRLDYETFVNASFFLQGKADEFTQHNAGKRKDVLSSILGLEIWETYRSRTADRRKTLDSDLAEIDGRLTEIEAELAEENIRKQRLKELAASLQQLATARSAQESALESLKRAAASLDEQRRLASALAAGLERARASLAGFQARLAEKQAERAGYAALVARSKAIEADFRAWKKARAELEAWDRTASQFIEHEHERAPLLEIIAGQKAALEQEQRTLKLEAQAAEDQDQALENLRAERSRAQALFVEAEARVTERLKMEEARNAGREQQAGLKVENERLKAEMGELKARIDKLRVARGAVCPLCGQSLSEDHRKSTLEEMELDGKQKGDVFRTNAAEMKALAERLSGYELSIAGLGGAEDELLKWSNLVSQLTERAHRLEDSAKAWKSTGRKRLLAVTKLLDAEKYALESRQALSKLDRALVKLGYDVSAHDAARTLETELRSAEEDDRKLATAREVSRQLDDEIRNIEAQTAGRQSEIQTQQAQYEQAAQALALAESQSPDLDLAELQLRDLREQENQVRDEVGAARQKVGILMTLRARKTDFASRREALQKQIAHHRALERALGKDGVPALLIEQALPQIESKANELLDRLSEGQMSIRFVTQAEYKDKKRDDLRETLDIQISDGAGVRDYEMYSGGEAFRVNFAIRLALSEVLAQRKGARLQTLVIDEGFGSQDTQGRQRLIEAINLVKDDFAKILVITHLDELKDAFPSRIEVEKTERGSTVTVV